MENIINSVKSLIGTYGFGAATVIVLTILIVNLIKKPITGYAEKLAAERGCDKSVVTRYIAYLPFGVSLLLTFAWRTISAGFVFIDFDWAELFASSVMYAAVAIATFESVKVNLRAYAAKQNARTDPAGCVTSEPSADADAADAVSGAEAEKPENRDADQPNRSE